MMERNILLAIGVLAWLSLLGLVWGILLGWFEATWIQQLIAGVIFTLVGGFLTLETGDQKQKKDDGD